MSLRWHFFTNERHEKADASRFMVGGRDAGGGRIADIAHADAKLRLRHFALCLLPLCRASRVRGGGAVSFGAEARRSADGCLPAVRLVPDCPAVLCRWLADGHYLHFDRHRQRGMGGREE